MKALIAIGLGLMVGMVLPVAGQAPPRQEIYITVTNRKELLVQPNQQVTEGQVLADTRGTTGRRIAILQLQQQIYSQPTIKPLPPVEPPPIAKPSLLKEETILSQLEQQIRAQEEVIHSLPDDPNILAHEQAKLKMLTQERLIRQGELDNKKYQYSLELNRVESIKQSQQQDYQRQLAIWQKSERERQINLAKLQLEIDDIKQQETLIRSPYAGVIQKVIWQAQRGNRLDVLVILMPTRSEPRTTLPDQSSRLLGGLALIGDPKLTSPTGTRYRPIRTR